MARSFAKLMVSVWTTDTDFRALPSAAQRLYFILISHPTISHAGVLPLQPRKWARLAPDTTPEVIQEALDVLAETNKIVVDEDTEEVLVRTFIKHEGGMRNPNISKAICAAIHAIESARLRIMATTAYIDNGGRECVNPQDTDPDEGGCQDPGERSPKALAEGIGNLPVPVPVPVPRIQAPEQPPPDFAAFWEHYPRRTDRKRAATAWRNLPKADRVAALSALPAHVAAWQQERRELQHIPHPTTWLHGRRWEDEIKPAGPRTRRVNGANVSDTAF